MSKIIKLIQYQNNPCLKTIIFFVSTINLCLIFFYKYKQIAVDCRQYDNCHKNNNTWLSCLIFSFVLMFSSEYLCLLQVKRCKNIICAKKNVWEGGVGYLFNVFINCICQVSRCQNLTSRKWGGGHRVRSISCFKQIIIYVNAMVSTSSGQILWLPNGKWESMVRDENFVLCNRPAIITTNTLLPIRSICCKWFLWAKNEALIIIHVYS